MRTLYNINIAFLCFILLLGLITLLNMRTLAFLMIALFFLGIFQGFAGIILFLASPKAVNKQLYVGGLVLFGILCNTEWLWMVLPIPMALYFTYLMYIENQPKFI